MTSSFSNLALKKYCTQKNAATGTVITMTFDSQGRRTEYKSVTNGVQNTWLRFLYDGYLCIQVLYSNAPYNVFKEFVWDPTEPVATRPLVFRYAPNNLNLFYAFDGNKNVSDVFSRMNSNGIGAHYDYAPFGAVTRTHSDSSASFDIVSLNPFRFSSEYYDSELDLVYYNYRHYSPLLGRFLSRDPIEEQGGWNLYLAFRNSPKQYFDFGGLESNFYRMIKLASKASLIETTKEIALSCLKEILGDVYQEATLVSSLKALCGEAGVNPRGSSHWSKLPIIIDLESELKKSTYDMIVDALVSSVLAILNDAKEVKRFRSLLEKLSVKHLHKEFSKVEKVALAGAISSEIANEIKEEFQLETKNYIRITKLNRKSCQIRYRTKIDFRLSYAGMFSTFSSESGDSVLGDLPAQLKNACGCCKK